MESGRTVNCNSPVSVRSFDELGSPMTMRVEMSFPQLCTGCANCYVRLSSSGVAFAVVKVSTSAKVGVIVSAQYQVNVVLFE